MSKAENRTDEVNAFMERLDHPFKPEVQAVRDIVKGVDPGVTEQIKWNAPTFSYQGAYLVTFNLHAKDRVHLVFHHPAVVNLDNEILEGTTPGRRMAYLSGMEDVKAKQEALEAVVRDLVTGVGTT